MRAGRNGSDVVVRELEPQPVVSLRATIRVEELGKVMGDRIQALSDYLQSHGGQAAGPFFVRYHTFGDMYTDMETGVPLVEAVAVEDGTSSEGLDGDRVIGGVLPGGPAVTTSHTGPHNMLGEAYARIDGWLKEQGREPDGPAREVYHWIDFSRERDPEDGYDPSTQRVELIQPFK
jgi:effector-binding domain-containing protein